MRWWVLATAAILLVAAWLHSAMFARVTTPAKPPQEPAKPMAPATPASGAGEPREKAKPPPDAVTAKAALPVRAPQPAALPPPGAPLALIHDSLKALAEAGDARASCRLAFEMQRCANLPGTRRFALQMRERSEEQQGSLAKRSRDAAAFFQARADAAEAACAEFPLERTKGAWKYLLRAAESGHVPSMARFVSGSVLLASNQLPMETLDGWIAFRDQAPMFLQRAIDAGEPAAFEMAAHAHARGQWLGLEIVPKDAARSVAYWKALETVASPRYAGTARANLGYVARQANLSPADVAQAEGLGATLARKVRVPEGGVDFANGTFDRDDGRHCEPA